MASVCGGFTFFRCVESFSSLGPTTSSPFWVVVGEGVGIDFTLSLFSRFVAEDRLAFKSAFLSVAVSSVFPKNAPLL